MKVKLTKEQLEEMRLKFLKEKDSKIKYIRDSANTHSVWEFIELEKQIKEYKK